jgi:bifunctional non-homologous end joining protein LigD
MDGSEDGQVDGPDRLGPYRAKRTFAETPEPSGEVAGTPAGAPRFVVQKHDARRLHYDFRLEADGVLISWAVPKGPSYDPRTKRLAVHVEDHPLDYRGFEGVTPGAQYGSGTVIVWDEGTYRNLTQHDDHPVEMAEAVRRGHLSVWLDGTKLHGGWSLTRTGGPTAKESWIMVKRADDHADPGIDITADQPDSVQTGRSLEAVAADRDSAQWTRERATWRPPMLAQLVKPADRSRSGRTEEWHYERKLDGLRCVAVRNGADVELWSRNHLSFNRRFPELVAALGALPVDNFTFDGEIVAYDGDRTSFARLQHPDRATRPVYSVFDLLYLLGQDTTDLPLSDRQALLAQALAGAPDTVTTVTGTSGEADALLAQACADGWEGLVAKRIAAPYRSGRSPDWQKLKCSASQELVIGGWTDPTGTRTGFGALLVGYYDDGGALHYAGKVGTGFDQVLLRDLHRALVARGRDESPFVEPPRLKGAHWAEPELVGAVQFSEWTRDGRLRHPSFQGLRPDKAPESVRREG